MNTSNNASHVVSARPHRIETVKLSVIIDFGFSLVRFCCLEVPFCEMSFIYHFDSFVRIIRYLSNQ